MVKVIQRSFLGICGLALVFSGCDLSTPTGVAIKSGTAAITSPSPTPSPSSSPSKQCLQPDTLQPVGAGTVYYSYTQSSEATQAACDAVKVTSICDAQSGMFLPAPSNVSKTCLVVGQTCAYTTGTGINTPSGNHTGATASGYASQSATYPQLCGPQATVTCQASGTWTGPTPLYTACSQKCLNPDSSAPVDSNSTYSYFTKSSGTPTQCNAAKVTSTCSQSSGQFTPVVSSTRYAACAITKPTVSLTNLPANSTTSGTASIGYSLSVTDPSYKVYCRLDANSPSICANPFPLSNLSTGAHHVDYYVDIGSGYDSSKPDLSYSWTIVGKTCSYATGDGVNSPTGNSTGATASGYATQAATYPTVCGSQATVTCQADGTWTGSTPRYSACSQKCVDPDSGKPVNANSTYSYFTKSSGTAAECNSAKATSTCSQTSGQFSPAVPSTRYAACTVSNSGGPVLVPAHFVSPNGSDSNDGMSATSPFRTLEKAQGAMQSSSIKTVYLMGGTYTRTATLNLGSSDAGESWLGYPGQVPVLDGGNSVQTAITVKGNNITIRWLTIQNVAQTGINLQNVSGIVIDSNTIKNIQSTGWNEGGVTAFNNISNVRISHNLIQNAQYAGILYANASGDVVKNLVMDSNAVYNSCVSFADCGALYGDDRNHGASGVVMSNNVVGNYGNSGNQSKAIYLDDQMSNATVKNNIVYGTGSQAIQIHAGDHNVFQNNIFDVTGVGTLGFYQYGGSTGYGMNGNIFTCNIVYSSNTLASALWISQIGQGDALPSVTHNLYWGKNGSFSNGGSIADSSATVANPGFVNPSQANYSFSSSVPSFCNFAPIDTSLVGPLPNL